LDVRPAVAKFSKLVPRIVLDLKAFVLTAVIILSVKVVISAVAPASYDLGLILWKQTVPGPWASTTNALASLSTSATGLSAIDWVQSPPSFSLKTMLFGTLVRLPVLLFDLGMAGGLYYVAKHMSASTQSARLTALVWLANPYNTFVIEMIATPDIAASFVTVLMALFLLKRKILYASVALAAGTALKLYPILLLLPIMAYLEKSKASIMLRTSFVGVSLLGLLTYLAWISPPGYFGNSALLVQYSPTTQPITALLNFGTEIGLSVGAVVLVLSYYAIWIFTANRNVPVIESVAAILLMYFTFSTLYPQYLLWALPFLTLDVCIRGKHRALLVLILALMFGWGFFYSGAYLTFSGYSILFFPLKGNQLPWYSMIVNQSLASSATQVLLPPFLRAGLSAATLVYVFTYFAKWLRSKP
jgi:hypothetical protein